MDAILWWCDAIIRESDRPDYAAIVRQIWGAR